MGYALEQQVERARDLLESCARPVDKLSSCHHLLVGATGRKLAEPEILSKTGEFFSEPFHFTSSLGREIC